MRTGVIVLAPSAVTQTPVAPAVAGSDRPGSDRPGSDRPLLTVAALAEVAIVATAAAVLATRAAIAGTELLGDALVRFDESLRDAEQRPIRPNRVAVEAEGRWQLAAEAARQVNVERRLVRAALARDGLLDDPDLPSLPPPIALADLSQRDVLARCHRLARGVEEVRAVLREKRALVARGLLQTGPAADRTLAESVLAWWHPPPARAAGQPPEAAAEPESDLDTEVRYWMDQLDDRAEPEDVAEAAGWATRAATVRPPASPVPHVRRLGQVVKRVNARLERRRRHATEAAAYLDVLAGAGPELDGVGTGTVLGRLEEVVAGDADLTEATRAEALRLLVIVQQRTACRHVAVRVHDLIAAEGHQVQVQPRTPGSPAVLRFTLPGGARRALCVAVSAERISLRMTAGRTPRDDDERRADAAAHAAADLVIDQVLSGLLAAGIDATIRSA